MNNISHKKDNYELLGIEELRKENENEKYEYSQIKIISELRKEL